MASDYHELLGALLQSQAGKGALKNLDRISAALGGETGKALLERLGSEGGEALKRAAVDAAQGDTDRAKRLLSSLLSTPEGSALIGQLVALLGEKR